MNVAFDDPELSDDALMVLYANGDMAAARILAMRHAPRVMGLAMRMLDDHASAEDVVQEAMLRLWRIARDWRQGEAKLSTWLYRVSCNLCMDQLRKRRIGVDIDAIDEPAADTPSAEQKLQDDTRHHSLRKALAALPERQRMAVTLRHIENLSNLEIAEIMEISVEAVESLTARGKQQLAKILRPMQDQIGYQS